MRRLRRADWLVFWSALFAAASLSIYWFRVAPSPLPAGWVGYAPLPAHDTGWDALGWGTVALILVTAALALVLVVLIASGARDAVNVPPGVFLCALTPLTFLVTLIVTLVKLGGGTTLETGGWVGVGSLAFLTAGAWLSIRDERVDQPSRHVEPPPARPAPPAA